MKQCDKCGTSNIDKARYCMSCGYELPLHTVVESQVDEPVAKKKTKKGNATGAILGSVFSLIVLIAIQQFFFKSEPTTAVLDKAMMQMASEINKSCPVMVDAETRLDNAVALPDKVFVYYYTLINYEVGNIDTLQLKSQLEPGIVNFVKTNPQMAAIRKMKVTFSYYYKDKNANYLFQIAVTPQQYE